MTLHAAHDGNAAVNIRHIAVYHGEDVAEAIKQFWLEHPQGDFLVAPVIVHGAAPRPELCSRASLIAALETADIPAGSATEQMWRACCARHGVAWPARLEAA
jgi:hypothetical protein